MKNKFGLTITLLLLVAVAMVGFMGWLTYQRLTTIAHSLHEGVRPNDKLLILSDISSRMADAESSISIYTLTHNPKDLAGYYKALRLIGPKTRQLHELTRHDSLLHANTDTIDMLINQKIRIWRQLVTLKDTNRVTPALHELSEKLEHKVDTQYIKSKKPLIKRMFASEKTDVDTVIRLVKPEDIKHEAEVIEEKETHLIKEKRSKEIKLIESNRILTRQLNSYISTFESYEKKRLTSKTEHADKLAAETNKYIGIFSIAVALLLMLVLIVIFNYLRKSRAYQKALHHAKLQAEKLAQTKEEFLANMGHEIRTPLNAVLGFTQQVSKRNTDPSLDEPLRIVTRSGEHLLQMVNDILDITKLNTGNVHLEKMAFNPCQVFNDVYTLFTPLTLDKAVELTLDCPKENQPVVIGDPYRLRQIVMNLTSNALKFTNEGYVHINVAFKKRPGNNILLQFKVIDTGIGIPEDKQTDIFEHFTQAHDNTTRLYGGTGLGLSIVKKLVDAHHGTISLKSYTNEGSEFSVSIAYPMGSISELENQNTNPLTEKINVPEELKVLVADDEPYNRKLIAYIFEQWNIPCIETENGAEVLDKLKNQHVDVILMDINMPGMNGYETAKKIREHFKDKSHQPKIIAITATNNAEAHAQIRESGMDGFIPKPFDEAQLHQAIQDIVPSGDNTKPTVNPAPDAELDAQCKIDYIQLNRMANGDKKFIREMLEMFVKQSRKGIVQIENHLANKQFSLVREEAHKMISPCRHLGLKQLVKQLRLMEEKAILAEKPDELEKLFQTIRPQIDKACEIIIEENALTAE